MTKGYKTSEFWVTTITGLAIMLNQSGLLGSIVLPIESIGVIAAIAFPYIISRGIAKSNN